MKANPRRARPMCRKDTMVADDDGDDNKVEFIREQRVGGGIYSKQAAAGSVSGNTGNTFLFWLFWAQVSDDNFRSRRPDLRHCG